MKKGKGDEGETEREVKERGEEVRKERREKKNDDKERKGVKEEGKKRRTVKRWKESKKEKKDDKDRENNKSNKRKKKKRNKIDKCTKTYLVITVTCLPVHLSGTHSSHLSISPHLLQSQLCIGFCLLSVLLSDTCPSVFTCP